MVVFRKSTSTLAKRTRKGPCKRKQHCWMLHVAPSLKPVKLFSQQLPSFLLFRDRRSVAQQCLIRLHSSSNIVGATHAHYAWFTKTYGLYPSHDTLQVPTLWGVVASVCTPLPTRTQQLPTLLRQQCWELLRAYWQWYANVCNNSQQCWDLQCIVGSIQPISLCKPCVMSVRGPNNVGRAAPADPTLLRYVSAITEQKKCWELLAEKFDRFQALRNNKQLHPTTCNSWRNMQNRQLVNLRLRANGRNM